MSSIELDDDTHHLVRDNGFLTEAQKLDAFVLTPPMVLTSALLYLMLAEGEIGATTGQGSSFVTPLLQSTKAYVHAVPLERFLQDAPALLSVRERLSVLINVSDAMVADGHIHEAEQQIFDKLTVAFGINPKALETFLEAITAKNNKAALGDFDSAKLDIQTPSPHVGLAAAVIKAVMAPDGSVAEDDLDRLEGLIGEYDGLLDFGLTQAPGASTDQLFETLAETLNRDQKLFVLTNVFEAMHKEGDVESPEKKPIFESLRAALGFTENAFKPIVLALKAKSAKSAATRDQAGAPILKTVRSKFERKPRGSTQNDAVDRGNVVQVGGPAGAVITVERAEKSSAPKQSFLFQTSAISDRVSEIKDRRSKLRHEAATVRARGPNFAKAKLGVTPRNENRVLALQGSATAQAQARLKLATTRQQLDSTRAANAEIRAQMDQALAPRKKVALPGATNAREPAASVSRKVAARLAVRDEHAAQDGTGEGLADLPFKRKNSPLAVLSAPQTGNPDPTATKGLGSAAAVALAQAFKNAKGASDANASPRKQQNDLLQGADFSDPDLMWRFALPVLLAAFWLFAGTPGSVWSSASTRHATKSPCWIGDALVKPLQKPQPSAGCLTVPKLDAGTRWTLIAAGAVHQTSASRSRAPA